MGDVERYNGTQRKGSKAQQQTPKKAQRASAEISLEGTFGTDEVSGAKQTVVQVLTETVEVSEFTTAEVFSQLRERLSEKPTANGWWACVDLVEKSKGKERSLLQGYLFEYAQSDKAWNRCRVPCGDWKKNRAGWKWSEVTSQPVRSLPDAVEVYCPPGTFRMGASPEDKQATIYELPAREVTLTRGFWALTTPVTQAMYEAVTAKKPSDFKGPKRPVECVTWFDAVSFCNQLSEQAGLTPAYQFHGEEEVEWLQDAGGYRLPTEAEWEYICRAGCSSNRYGPLGKIAWYRKNSCYEKHPVGQKEANAWGLFDTLGNVYEWCFDGFDYYSKIPQVDPVQVPNHADIRVIRGGYSSGHSYRARASHRYQGSAERVGCFYGFRFVRNARVLAQP